MPNAISGTFFLSVALKSTVLLCVAWIAVLLLRRRSAALRHLVWSMAFASLLVLPLLSVWLPALRLPVNPSALSTGLLFKIDAQPHAGSGTIAHISMSKQRADSRAPIDWGLLLTFGWAAGVMLSFAQMLIGIAVIERRRRLAKPLETTEAAAMARQLGLRTPVHVLETEAGSMPMTYGFRRPAIFLPADAVTWDPERLRFVLLHELAHVRRRDGAAHLGARIAMAFYWWNPLAWSAWREFLKERERAADDLVLGLGTRASDYASQLLEIASCMQAAPAFAWAGVPMARRSQLENRLSAILDSGCNRKTVERVSALVVSLSAILIMLPVAAVHAKNGLPQAPAAANADSAHPVTAVLVKEADEAREQRQLDQARTLYTEALGVSGAGSETAAILIRLGTLELSAKNYEQAISDFDKAQAADAAKTAEAQMWMAIARERENNSEAAEALFQSALAAAAPDSVSAAVIMRLHAALLRQQSRLDEAAAIEKQADGILKVQLAPSAQSPGLDVYRVGGSVTAPIVLSKSEPRYTEDARIAKYSGTVLLSVEISADGTPGNIQVIRPLGLGLDEKATEAVRQWRFKPGTKDGQPVKVSARIEVNFRLL